MLLALNEMEKKGISFNVTYSRGPFFLMGSQKDIDDDNRRLGLPLNATNKERMQAKGWDGKMMDRLFAQAGLPPKNKAVTDERITAPTMSAHRLVQWATTQDNQKGEAMWHALSRRWFMGMDTDIRPIRLDSRELLLECCRVAGIDEQEAGRVLDGEAGPTEAEIAEEVAKVHAVGIHSIPNIVFEVEGLAKGSWLYEPETPYRTVHHGSGSCASFQDCLERMHQACIAAH